MPDQRIASGTFNRQFFTLWDAEQTFTANDIDVESTNSDFTDDIGITWGVCNSDDHDNGCPNGGYYIDFPNPAGITSDPSATIKVRVTDNTDLEATSAFTLRKDSAVFPPVVAGIPNETIQNVFGFGYGPVWFVAGDLDNAGQPDAVDENGQSRLRFTWSSDNTDLVTQLGIDVQPVGNMTGRTHQVTVRPLFNRSGRAVITITCEDPDGNFTSVAFVLFVVPSGNTPPSFTTSGAAFDGTFKEHDLATEPSYKDYYFKVSDAQTTDPRKLKIRAVSSNSGLVKNDNSGLSITPPNINGVGHVRITPQALPLPNPGVPQASTITLTAVDDAFTTSRLQFLYVAINSNWPGIGYIRPNGIWNFDPETADDQRPDDDFLTGEMHQISWREIDNGGAPSTWNWNKLDNAFAHLPDGQQLSLNLIEEPCDIAEEVHSPLEFDPWCDTNPPKGQRDGCPNSACGPGSISRAVPWDAYLRERRNTFLQELAAHELPNGNTVAEELSIPIINPNLPGGDSGIRELNNEPFSNLTLGGYSREKLRYAIKDELDHLFQYFSTKLVHMGFFIVEDDENQTYHESLWRWLYPQLRDRYDGSPQPRVHFFQEDLAAKRASVAADFIPYTNPPTPAYTVFPDISQVPSFFFYPARDNGSYKNGITYQANTPWSAPLDDGDKVDKTLNGSPNDGLEGAFNGYLCQYLEVYLADLDHANPPEGTPPAWDRARWAAGLQSWHDYTDYLRTLGPTEGAAGLTVNRASSTNNTVSWYPIFGATTYTLQAKSLSPLGDWVDVKGCDPLSTSCTDTNGTGSQYAYRVQGADATGKLLSPWSQVAVFLSESKYDGYVSNDGETSTPVSDGEPGLQAGQGEGTDLSGFLSFDTSVLGSAATVLSAKLRLKQSSSNDGFKSLGTCMVDLEKGNFNSNVELEGADFAASETVSNVITDEELVGVDSGNWAEAYVDSAYEPYVNTTDRTQFRIYFNHVDGLSDTSAAWYSAESIDSEPQLIVQYSEP